MATASSILLTNHAYPSCVHLCASCQGVTTSTAAANAIQHPGLALRSTPINKTDTAMRFKSRTRSTEPLPKFRQRTSALSWSLDRSESLSEAWRALELPPLPADGDECAPRAQAAGCPTILLLSCVLPSIPGASPVSEHACAMCVSRLPLLHTRYVESYTPVLCHQSSSVLLQRSGVGDHVMHPFPMSRVFVALQSCTSGSSFAKSGGIFSFTWKPRSTTHASILIQKTALRQASTAWSSSVIAVGSDERLHADDDVPDSHECTVPYDPLCAKPARKT